MLMLVLVSVTTVLSVFVVTMGVISYSRLQTLKHEIEEIQKGA